MLGMPEEYNIYIYTYSFVRSFVHSFIHSCMYSFIFIHVLIHLVVYFFLCFFLSFAPRRVPPAPRLDANCAGQGLLLKEYGSWGCGVKNTVLLGRTKSRLGQTWPSLAFSWAEHEPTWTQLGDKLALQLHCGPTSRNLGTFGRKLGLTCATWSCVGGHLPLKLGPGQAQHGESGLSGGPKLKLGPNRSR